MNWFRRLCISGMSIIIDGLTQDCSNSIANALELSQSLANASIYCTHTYLCTPSVTAHSKETTSCVLGGELTDVFSPVDVIFLMDRNTIDTSVWFWILFGVNINWSQLVSTYTIAHAVWSSAWWTDACGLATWRGRTGCMKFYKNGCQYGRKMNDSDSRE